MSDFRVKLLALTAFGTLFAGLSFGQVNCTNAGAGTPVLNTGAPILVRAESEADLVSDPTITCTGSNVVANGQLTVFTSLPVTSKAIPPIAGLGSGNSEALLTVTPVAPSAGAAVTYQGTVSGSVVTFSAVAFPANFTARISNIRVNASGSAVGSTPVAITESIFAGTNGLATYNASTTVGFALKALANPGFLTNAAGIPLITNIAACTGNSAAFVAPGLNFTVLVGETFGGFFKTQTGIDSGTGAIVVQNGEQGSLQNAANAGIGTASSATNISITYGNVPAAATIYVPTTITYTPAGGSPAQLSLTPAATAATSPAGIPLLPAASGAYAFGGYAAFSAASGSVTVTYTVTLSSAAQIENFQVPTYVTVAANAAAAQGPITVLEAFSPAAALVGLPSSIPIFAPPTNTALNGPTVTLCQTSILFPFVTNQLGFDTGIVLTNASTDNLGAAGRSVAAAQAGTCNLSFYGAGAPTPATGVADPGGNLPTASTHAFLLSAVAPGFQGYMIAQCPFQWAHGFGFLAYNLTQANGAVEGFIAPVLARGSTAPEAVSF